MSGARLLRRVGIAVLLHGALSLADPDGRVARPVVTLAFLLVMVLLWPLRRADEKQPDDDRVRAKD
ncbi:MAG TPA: hypothetical protein VGD67_26415 [Pseudonocardiaceae bacterium]